MPIPVSVVLDRTPYGSGPLDLTPRVAEGSLAWSSVVPGGFASCSFTLQGDFRNIVKEIPYLSILRVLADSGRILWEGQIEDLSPTVSEGEAGVKVGAFGLQNALKEQTVRKVWSLRDMVWTPNTTPTGTSFGPGYIVASGDAADIGNIDPTDYGKSGVQFSGDGATSMPNSSGYFVEYNVPSGITVINLLGTYNSLGTDAGVNNWQGTCLRLSAGVWTEITRMTAAANHVFNQALSGSPNLIRLGVVNNSGVAHVPAASDRMQFYTMRLLGVIAEDFTDSTASETIASGFFGDTLIKSLLTFVPALGQGTIESGSDFTIDHLDASVRRTAYDILQEIVGYYSREWAVWEDALLHWRTPNLSQPQWIIPIAQLSSLDLDASTQNSKKTSYVLYTDAATGLTGEASVAATDRRNPYVKTARAKDEISPAALTMTSNTAAQLAAIILNDLGFGPVPASGSISLPGDSIVQHAQGNSVKAWELRAGDNVTIPELPMADVFTQDGRGESLFHIVSTEAETSGGLVTLTLDSYGSKRSDVLLARLAAVTQALGG